VPAVEGSFAVEIGRYATGSGTTSWGTGVLLKQGELMPANIGNVSIDIAGSEVAVYVEAMDGTYSDGSLLAVWVEGESTITYGSSISGTLYLNRAFTGSRRTKRTVTWPSTDSTSWKTVEPTNLNGYITRTSAADLCAWGGWIHPLVAWDSVPSSSRKTAYKSFWDAVYPAYVTGWDGVSINAGS
jgi:hypothetical protein